MTYRAVGVMSGSSLDGLDIAFVEFDESGGRWTYDIKRAECISYSPEWVKKLASAVSLPSYEYLLLHSAYGKLIGENINRFIKTYELDHQVQLIASHGHTTFHAPEQGMTAQLGDGAAIAAVTGINVVSDLRALDVAFGGEGAPIVPIGEKLLLGDYDYFLNLGGIANVSFNTHKGYTAFDTCAANRVLNLLVQKEGREYDAGGAMAASGKIDTVLLTRLNALDYYRKPFPKSLANSFGTDQVLPLVVSMGLSTADALRTYVEHIVMQVAYAIPGALRAAGNGKMLVTGGGALNTFLVERLRAALSPMNVEVVVPSELLVNFKEALIMALIGVLRWREEYNVLHTVTGAVRSSIGGAVWIGQEA